MLGASLGPGVQGPRLSDTNVQISSYGAAIGMVWGGVRKAGNVFWSTPLKESAQEEGGKGGPSVTTYTYSVSCAVGICEGVQGSIRRIWADAKLVFDASDDASEETKISSATFRDYFEFYPGDETQLPDPTIEQHEGAGNVPAYLGTCYVVFTDLPLGDFGNRIPVFSFELSNAPEQPSALEYVAGPRLGEWSDTGSGPYHSAGVTEYTVLGTDGTPSLTTTDLDAALAELASRAPGKTTYIGYYTNVTEVLSIFGYETALNYGNGAVYAFLCFNQQTPDVVRADGLTYPGGLDACYQLAISSASPLVPTTYMFSSYQQGRGGLLRMAPFGTSLPGYTTANNCTNYSPIGDYYPVALHSANAVIRAKRLPTYPLKMCLPGVPTVGAPAELPGNPDVCLFIDGQIAPQVNFTVESGSFLTLKDYADPGNVITQLPYGPTIRASDPRATDAAFWNAAADAVGIAERYNPPSLPQAIAQAAVGTANLSSVAAGGVTLAVIVRDICRRAGLRDDQIDVTALTDLVLGFQIGRQTSARADLEPLRQAFWFDAVESGEVIRFVKRGGAPVAHLTFDDLGAGEEQSTEPIEPTRMQETDLPAAVAVAYSAVTADYQTGTQTARRMATVSQQQTGVELPVVLTDQHAANVADVLMYDAWTSRTERVASVLRGWADLEPTDVITVDDGEFVYSLRIIDKEEDGPVIKLTMRDEDAAAYEPEAHAVPTPGGGSEVTFVGPTNLMMLDIPLLRQEDDRYGIYATARPYAGAWPGARAYRSNDAGASYVEVDTLARQGVIGYARTALADFDGGNVVDEINTVLVRIYGGELSSITYAELLNNGNAAVLGDEIIQYRTATLVEEGTYRLSGLLRGRLGTEYAMGAHALTERFAVLSSASLYRFTDSLALRDSPQLYKAVTFGQTLASAVAVDGTNSGASQKPLSPVHLQVAPRIGGGYSAAWVRRTRFGGVWASGTDVPLAEADERYVVTVLDGATVVEQVTVTEPMAVLGSLGDDFFGLTLQVQQVSASVGAGFAAAMTIPYHPLSSAKVVELLLAGTATPGVRIYVYLGGVRFEYLLQTGDTLADAAAELGAVIDASTSYAALVTGTTIRVTGPLSVAFSVSAGVDGGAGAFVSAVTLQTAAAATPGNKALVFYRWQGNPTEAQWAPSLGSWYLVVRKRGAAYGDPDIHFFVATVSLTSHIFDEQRYINDGLLTANYGLPGDSPLVALPGYSGSGLDVATRPTSFPYTPPSDWSDNFASTDPTIAVCNHAIVFPLGEVVNVRYDPNGPSVAGYGEWEVYSYSPFNNSTIWLSIAAGPNRQPTIAADRPQISSVAVSGEVSVGDAFTVTLNGIDYSYTALSGDTAEDVAAVLAAALSADTDFTITDTSGFGSGSIRIERTAANVPFTVSVNVITAVTTLTSTTIQEAS